MDPFESVVSRSAVSFWPAGTMPPENTNSLVRDGKCYMSIFVEEENLNLYQKGQVLNKGQSIFLG